MVGETIMGIPIEEIRRQLDARPGYDVDPQSKMRPINPNNGILDPCIRGGKKILQDPELKEMLREIYIH